MRLMKSLDEDTGLEIRYESAIKKLLDISGPETIFWTTSYSRHPIYLLYFPMVVTKPYRIIFTDRPYQSESPLHSCELQVTFCVDYGIYGFS